MIQNYKHMEFRYVKGVAPRTEGGEDIILDEYGPTRNTVHHCAAVIPGRCFDSAQFEACHFDLTGSTASTLRVWTPRRSWC